MEPRWSKKDCIDCGIDFFNEGFDDGCFDGTFVVADLTGKAENYKENWNLGGQQQVSLQVGVPNG
jgi:hypothetical protein